MLLVVARDSYDWLTFGVQVLAAVATVAAVSVALLGPGLRARRRRPRISIDMGDRASARLSTELGHAEEVAAGPAMYIRNAAGKDAARGVEVAVTLEHRENPGAEAVTVADDRRLNFIDPLIGTQGVATADVPAGGARRVYLTLLGRQPSLLKQLSPPSARADTGTIGALATCPSRGDNTIWLPAGHYTAQLVVAGANFDAAAYQIRFQLDYHPAEVKDSWYGDPEARKPDWVEFVLTDGPTIA